MLTTVILLIFIVLLSAFNIGIKHMNSKSGLGLKIFGNAFFYIAVVYPVSYFLLWTNRVIMGEEYSAVYWSNQTLAVSFFVLLVLIAGDIIIATRRR